MRKSVAAMALVVILAGCRNKSSGPSTPSSGSGPVAAGTSASPSSSGWRATLDGQAIPACPAAGSVCGEAFTMDRAEIEEGILHVRQGKEFFAEREFTVFLFLKEKGALPEGKTWDIKADAEFGHPHIHMGHKVTGENLPKIDMFMTKYAMKLEFGRESGGKLPGKIWLCLPDDTKSFVVGEFVAQVKGFVLRNGQADRRNDSLELLKWLAEEKLGADNPGRKAVVANSEGGNYSTAVDKGEGSSDFEWTLDGAKKGWIKVRYAKEKGEWRVVGTWPGEQIPEAHPSKIPGPKDAGEEPVKFLGAAELEKSLGGKVAHVINVRASLKPGVAAACVTQCQLEGQNDWKERTWLFKWTDGGWTFDHELSPGEKFDARTGTVVAK